MAESTGPTSLLYLAFGDLILNSAVPAIDFPQFEDLAPEIRSQIFALNVTTVSRTVKIEVKGGYVIGSRTAAPVTLHINQEARQVALKILRAFLPDSSDGKVSTPIYYHPKNDTIEFHGDGYTRPQDNFISAKAVPLYRNPSSILELGHITTLRLTEVEMNDDLLSWIVSFASRGDNPLFNNVNPFTGLKKIEIFIAKPRKYVYISNRTRAQVEAERAQLFYELFKIHAPTVYDATDKPYLEVTGPDGELIGRFWDESYDMTVATVDVNGVISTGN